MPVAEFEGQKYDFPEGTTQEEMMQTLSNLPQGGDNALSEEPEDEPKTFAEEETIKKDEGIRRDKDGSHVSYRDSKGNPTGGIGHLLTEEERELYPKGTAIPDEIVTQWFNTDMAEADSSLTRILEKKAVRVPDDVYSVLLNMAYNLGEEGLLGFTDMWDAIEVGDWQRASAEMKDSKWAKDVGNRAVRLADRMANIKSIRQQEVTQSEELTPSKGGLFEDENGTLFIVDEMGNKKEV